MHQDDLNFEVDLFVNIFAPHYQNKTLRIVVPETRPLLSLARANLIATLRDLGEENLIIPVFVLTDLVSKRRENPSKTELSFIKETLSFLETKDAFWCNGEGSWNFVYLVVDFAVLRSRLEFTEDDMKIQEIEDQKDLDWYTVNLDTNFAV